MTVYEASVAVHVGAAVLGFGPTFAYPLIQLAAERGDRRALPFAIGSILRISRTLAVPMAVVVGLTGAYQVADGPWSLGDAWLLAGLVLYVAPGRRAAGRRARQRAAGGLPHLQGLGPGGVGEAPGRARRRRRRRPAVPGRERGAGPSGRRDGGARHRLRADRALDGRARAGFRW